MLQTDASQTGWGTSCQGISTGGLWTKEEQKFHINALEHLAVTLVLLTFTKGVTIKSIHFQINNKTALPYLLKIEGIGSSVLVRTNKDLEYFNVQMYMITAEYL